MPSKVRRWNGSAWQECYLYRWNGSAWILCGVYRWNGVMWIPIQGEVPLYNEGNEYPATTGGYVINDSAIGFTASSQYAYGMHTTLGLGVNLGSIALHTAGMIDLTNINYLYADYYFTSDYNAYNNSSGLFGVSKNPDFNVDWSSPNNLNIFPVYQILGNTGGAPISGRLVLDVRGLTGTYYVGTRAMAWGATTGLYVYKMWGE